MRNFKFYKEEDGRWYIYLLDFPGEKEELEMVAGADTMLDIYSQGEDVVYLTLTADLKEAQEASDNIETLSLVDLPESGATYLIEKLNGVVLSTPLPVWLCDVTIYVFDTFPTEIYIIR